MLKLSLKRKEEQVELTDDVGQQAVYTMKELTGTARDQYLNFTNSKVKIDPKTGQSLGMRSVDGLYDELISLSLYDNQGKRVPNAIIQGWPSSVQSILFQKAQELSGLGEAAPKESDLKNDSQASA